MYVCKSVSWLTSLLKLYKYRDISSSGWDIFLKFFGDISGMLAGQFQIIQKFLYVCQSVKWLTSLLQLDKYRDISGSGWDMFLKLFGDIPEMLVQQLQIILNFLVVCQSVCWLTLLLKLDKFRDISSSGCLRVNKFRELLPLDYEDSSVLQFMDLVFPLVCKMTFY